jgi:Clp amino terminal domain, pathogenicity island component
MGPVPIDDTAPLRPTSRYRDVLRHAEAEARRRGHHHLGAEHLLLGILDGGESAATAAIAKFVDIPTVRRELERILASEVYARADPRSPTHSRDGDGRSESVPVGLVRGAERQQAVIHWWWRARGPENVYRAELEWSGPAIEVGAHDMFEALARIREQVEPQGWFVAVQGSRLDTFPSGMQRDMGGGLSVYVLRMGEPVRLGDVVETLAEADPSTLATVAAQRDHAMAWTRSVDDAAG